MTMWSPTSRPIQPRTNASPRCSTRLCRARSTARSGARCERIPARSCGLIPAPIRRKRRSRKSTTCRYPDSVRAAATSTARAWCGRRSRAATSAASTAASARVRSTAPRRPAIIARRVGPCTSIRGPASKASARTAPNRATTAGSISTTRSASARTCRCRPPISWTGWSRSKTAR